MQTVGAPLKNTLMGRQGANETMSWRGGFTIGVAHKKRELSA